MEPQLSKFQIRLWSVDCYEWLPNYKRLNYSKVEKNVSQLYIDWVYLKIMFKNASFSSIQSKVHFWRCNELYELSLFQEKVRNVLWNGFHGERLKIIWWKKWKTKDDNQIVSILQKYGD